MIVDTDFLIAIDEGIETAHTLGDQLELADVPLRVPTPVIFELFASVGSGDDPGGKFAEQRSTAREQTSRGT